MTKSGMTLKTICIVLLLIACIPPTAATSVVQLTNDSASIRIPFGRRTAPGSLSSHPTESMPASG